MWLFYALLTPIFWGAVHMIDTKCVDDIFDKAWMGMITSAIASCVILVLFPIIAPFIELELPAAHIICLALLAGFLIQVSQAFYFQSLSESETGIVAAYWNLTPTLIPIISFILFRNTLNSFQYLGIGILITTSVLFCFLDTNLKHRWKTFSLMFAASMLQAVAILIEDTVFDNTSYFSGFLLITTGLIITGLLPLAHKPTRKSFAANLKKILPAKNLIFGTEIINLLAIASSQKAVDLGNPSITTSIEATVPAHVFAISLILFLIGYKRKFFVDTVMQKIPQKILYVGLMVLGVWLVS